MYIYSYEGVSVWNCVLVHARMRCFHLLRRCVAVGSSMYATYSWWSLHYSRIELTLFLTSFSLISQPVRRKPFTWFNDAFPRFSSRYSDMNRRVEGTLSSELSRWKWNYELMLLNSHLFLPPNLPKSNKFIESWRNGEFTLNWNNRKKDSTNKLNSKSRKISVFGVKFG